MNSRARRSSWTRFSWACSRRRLRGGAALVALTAGLAYLPSLDHGFIYDDYWTVVGNRHLEKGLGELLRAAASGRSVEWKMPDATRPTMGVSLWLDRQLFDLSASGHHLHSLALYAAVSVLVFLLAFALLRRFSAALGAGVAFAVTPLHCEVASAVNYREDLLASVGLFGALTLCFWPARSAARWQPYAVALLWFYALASKESALVGPLLLGALALVRRPARWTREGALGLGAAVSAALWSNWRFGLSALGEQIPRAEDATWLERGVRTARFELWSAAESFFPLVASPEYDPPPVPHWGWLAACVALVAAAAALYRLPRARPFLGLLGVALAAPLLTCPLVAPTNEVADRYWFVGSLVAALAVGWGTQWLARRQQLVALGLLAVLGAVGVQRCWSAAGAWASEVSLWTTSVANAPRSPRAWASLSRVHRMADQDELAERAIQRALSIRPDYVPAQVAQALNYLWVGDRSSARRVLDNVVPKSDLHRDALAVASRCAFLPTDAAAGECARRAVPKGMLLGDPELLRRESERFLSIPLERSDQGWP